MKRIISLLFIISLFLCYLSNASAGELKITSIVVDESGYYNIVLNNAIKIDNISLKNKNDTKIVEFPVYSGKGKTYRQFSALSREFGNYLAYSIDKNSVYDFNGKTSFKINKFSKVKKEGNIKAFASVIFEDLLEVECRVMKGKNQDWIAWPANKTASGWKSEFSFTDKKLKESVESGLIQKYNKKDERK